MTDDPWKKPDPNALPYAPPPSQYPPNHPPNYPPQYPPNDATLPYGPPQPGYGYFDPNNPYGAPLPQRGSIKRLVWILLTAGVLLLGGCGVGVYFLATSLTKNADEANAFLRDVRDRQFALAYDQLCPAVQQSETLPEFSSNLLEAAERGHGVTYFDITNTGTYDGTGGSSRTAGGTVTFADGTTQIETFGFEKSNGKLCISSGYDAYN